MPLALAKGEVFAEDYRIERRLGEGGMGSVYVATQLSTSAPRALKLMHVHLAIDPSLRRRFEQEARISAKIKSDHVVQVTAAGVEEETRTPWLAMELLEGETLGALVTREGRLEAPLVAEIFLQLCHALAAAHEVGVVHRDLKPENVFIAKPQRPGAPFTLKVLDFGISKVIAEAMTKSTEPLGTPLWMSPEQTQHDQPVTPASDVWSLGLLAFYLLTGKLYWRGAEGQTNPVMLLRQIVLDPLPRASERAREHEVDEPLPEGFDAWFARCVAREPSERFPNAGEAQLALAELLGSEPLSAMPSLPAVSVAPPPKRAPTPFELSETTVPSTTTPQLPARGFDPRKAIYAVIAGVLVILAWVGGSTFVRGGPPVVEVQQPRAPATPSIVEPEPSAVDTSSLVPPVDTTAPVDSTSASSAEASQAAPSQKRPEPLAKFDANAANLQLSSVLDRARACVTRDTFITVTVFYDGPTGKMSSKHVDADSPVVRQCVIELIPSTLHVRPFPGGTRPFPRSRLVLVDPLLKMQNDRAPKR